MNEINIYYSLFIIHFIHILIDLFHNNEIVIIFIHFQSISDLSRYI